MTNYLYLDIKYLITRKIWLTLKGKILGNLIKVFYVKWSNNLGDLLTPIILKHYNLTPVYAYPKKAQVAVVGTILEIVGTNFSGYILGSGWSRDITTHFPYAKIKGVRGFYTKHNLQINENTTIGDPGLLIADILPYKKNIQYKLGIIPHESEIENESLKNLKRELNKDILIISPRRSKVTDALKEIVSCQYIVSSSLHGLIISDSYGIPNGRIKFNDIDDSKDYKFKDYYSSLNEELMTLDITGKETLEELIKICRMPPQQKISEIKKKINTMFYNFTKEIKK